MVESFLYLCVTENVLYLLEFVYIFSLKIILSKSFQVFFPFYVILIDKLSDDSLVVFSTYIFFLSSKTFVTPYLAFAI